MGKPSPDDDFSFTMTELLMLGALAPVAGAMIGGPGAGVTLLVLSVLDSTLLIFSGR